MPLRKVGYDDVPLTLFVGPRSVRTSELFHAVFFTVTGRVRRVWQRTWLPSYETAVSSCYPSASVVVSRLKLDVRSCAPHVMYRWLRGCKSVML